ncbi:hypothetical protein C8J57DRAFT_1667807 [Mycena rebaudengoi]|nr:hypothetical protein C8J57DRAFT_1667807 [Mycena rebaudengoi]
MFEDWVRRAGSSPLSVVMEYRGGAVEWSRFPTVFHQIIARPSQWRDVELDLTYKPLFRPEFQTALQGKLHALERLILKAGLRFPTAEAISLTAFETAPKLRAVRLVGFPPSSIKLPWNQLTSFIGENLYSSDCARILGMTPLLIDCTLTDKYNRYNTATDIPTPPPLLHLRSLVLDGNLKAAPARWTTTQGSILGVLTLPALNQLHLPLRFDNLNTFLPFITRSRPSALRKLVLHAGYRCLIQGAASMPALSDVTIDQPSINQATELLAALRDSPAFIPNLVSLRIMLETPPKSEIEETKDIFEDGYETLVQALSRRWNAGGSSTGVCLSKFNLTWLENEEDNATEDLTDEDIGIYARPDVRERLLDLMDEGMDIYLGTLKKNWLIPRA